MMIEAEILKLEKLLTRISTKTFIGMHYVYLDTSEAIRIIKGIHPRHLEKLSEETARQYYNAVNRFYEINWTSSQVSQLASKYRPGQEQYDKFNRQQQRVSSLLGEIIEMLKQLTPEGKPS